MKKLLLPPFIVLPIIFVFIAAILSCAGNAKVPLPALSTQSTKLKESPPAPIPPADGQASSVTRDPVTIAPEKAVGYKNLPTSITQIFDTPPRPVSLYDVVAESVANNHLIKIQGYNLRVAEYQVPLNKGIYDLIFGAQAQYQRNEQQTSTAGFGSLGVNSSRSLSGEISLQQLMPTGGTINLAYQAARVVNLIPNIIAGVDPVTKAPTFAVAGQNVVDYSNQATFNITQPLLQGFGPSITNAQIRIAQLEQQGAAADFQTNIENQLSLALQTYWELIGAIETYKVQVISYSAALDLLRVNTAKFKAGTVAKTEVLQADAAAQARKVQVIQARLAVRDIEDQLKRLIFLQEGSPLWDVEIRPTQPIAWREMDADLNRCIEVALRERPEMRRAQSNINQTEVNRKVAKNMMLPQLNAVAQVQPNGFRDDFSESFDTMSDGKFVSYSAGLTFSFPIQNRTARYRFKQAVARQQQAEESEKDLEDSITLDVRQAVRDLKTAREQIAVTQAQIASAQATLDAELKRLEVGISTSFQVLQFQENVATAQDQHIRAVVGYNRAAIRLERARGTMLKTYWVTVEGTDLNPPAKPVFWPVGMN